MRGRRMWTQSEVVRMGKFLGFQNWDRRAIRYWIDQGLFPEPIAEVKGMISFYKDDQLELAFVDIGMRLRTYVKVTPEDVEMARQHVLADNRAKNVSRLINTIKES